MWEPFTEAARRALTLAQQEAQQRGVAYIGTEHLLLAMAAGDCVAGQVLCKLGVNRARLQAEVEAIIGVSPPSDSPPEGFTPRVKRVIELAFEHARAMSHNYIGTEHLLLGLAEDNQGVAARALANLGVQHHQIHWELVVAPALERIL